MLLNANNTHDAAPITLACDYSSSVDEKGNSTEISGSVGMTISIKNGQFVAMTDNTCQGYFGQATDQKLTGSCEVQIQETPQMTVHSELSLNRITGELTITYSIKEGRKRNGLVHFGKCRRVEKLF